MTLSPTLRIAAGSLFWATIATTTGCASGPTRFGDSARYDATVRAYVLAPEHGPDEEVDRRQIVILGDPLTGEKLRCREQLEPWLALQRAVASDGLHDENVAIGSIVAMSPFVAVGSAIIILGVVVASPAFVPIAAGSSSSSYALYERGTELLAAKQYGEAASHFQRAVVKSPNHIAVMTPAFYYLGVSYSKLERPELAARAMQAFIHRSQYSNDEMYSSAEAWLAYMKKPVTECASIEPLPIQWRENP